MLTEKPTTDGPESLRAILKDGGSVPDDPDLRARREGAILAFAGRSSAQSNAALLLQDAGIVLTQVLQADFNAVARSMEGNALMLTISGTKGGSQLARPSVHKVSRDPAGSMVACAIHAKEPVVSEDLAHELRFSDPLLRGANAVSGLTVPLHAGDRVFGAVGIYQKRKRRFSDEDVRFAEIIGHLLTASLARISLEEDLRSARSQADQLAQEMEQLSASADKAASEVEEELFEKLNVDEEAGRTNAAAPSEAVAGRELRSSLRRPFNCRQRIAPIVDGAMPTSDDFFEVECRDISAGGISFFLEDRPAFKNLIVALGTGPLESFVVARVVRVFHADEGSPMPYLVGCRFTGRISK